LSLNEIFPAGFFFSSLIGGAGSSCFFASARLSRFADA
jgi:hypothetical protein